MMFNSICTDILECVAPVRIKEQKPKSYPWLNNTTQALRWACRRAERNWKKKTYKCTLKY